MGRIKTTLIKRTTKELVKNYGDELRGDFSKLKGVVGVRLTKTSKKVRNVIAGYAARLSKKKDL